MAKLKIASIPNDKPVRLTIELPATVHRDLLTYADALARESGQTVDPSRLIAPMLGRFMAADRGFAKIRRSQLPSGTEG
ncbi:DUF2274 domain-containing protein [Bradyrhizobium quebecense]|uniref:DUF2274 domain-containing protein n=2 Tax=Bradyrhizobium quebecense TaxID=2748629 RepID=A0ABS3MTC3_9BRAD|nr:DUF2274 domain-containing protein [Bradyrhizobium quebecense]UGY02507.1 DUF2274 domain-containing protein [Bradyrhizobium quebecense]